MAGFGIIFIYTRDFIRGVNPFTPGKIKAKHEAKEKAKEDDKIDEE